MLQFIKKREIKSGEHLAARSMDGIEILPLGDGFTWLSKNIEADRALAREGWAQCVERLHGDECDVVILDEITYCINYGWLDIDEVLAALEARRLGMHVVLTGRDAPAKLIERADLVTEMAEVKHPYSRGVTPQKGIDL